MGAASRATRTRTGFARRSSRP
jgi:Alkylmercury lyase